ncbi:MAG TPA: hypothetical protein VGJ00_02955 [Rhabdochlamydiaceae bacterium]|jgi:hypothetical protein
MSQKATTKDELFLVKLHQLALQQGSFESEIDRYTVGRAIGQNDRGVNAIVVLLAKANFVKKGEGSAVYLTALGLSLATQLASK